MPSTKRGKPYLSPSLFEEITELENFEKAYKQTQKGKGKYKTECILFNKDAVYNLERLRQSVITGSYRFSGYNRFTVYEPKERVVDAPGLKDKIVQIAINNVLKSVYHPKFIHDSYSCIDNKGTHKCVDRVSYFMRKASWEYGEDAQIIEIDIKKFFYSINRDTLKLMLPKRISCARTLNLLYTIIDSADVIALLGLPLGNTLSQIGANIYMNEVDQHCKRKLGLRYYIRYADDVLIIVKSKERAKTIMQGVTSFISERLDLAVNENKTQIFPLEQGVNTVGFKIHKTHRLLRNESKKKMKRKAKKLRRLLVDRRIEPEKVEQMFNSWLGHAKHGCSHNFLRKLVDKYDYLFLTNKGIIKVDLNPILKERERLVIPKE